MWGPNPDRRYLTCATFRILLVTMQVIRPCAIPHADSRTKQIVGGTGAVGVVVAGLRGGVRCYFFAFGRGPEPRLTDITAWVIRVSRTCITEVVPP